MAVGYHRIITKQWNIIFNQQIKGMQMHNITWVFINFSSTSLIFVQGICISMVSGYNKITPKQWNITFNQQIKEIQRHSFSLVFTFSFQ